MSEPNRMGAVWCEDHQRWECSKRSKRSQSRCHAVALVGLDACFSHSGKRREIAKAEGQAITAWNAQSGKPAINSADAVLGMLQMSWLRVHLYATLLHQQVGDASNTHGLVGSNGNGETIRALAQLEAAERDRCVRYGKTAHDMDLDERVVVIAEQQGALLAGAVQRILDALELTPQQRARVPEVVPAVLRQIEQGAA
jgi:hypothetical protein